MTDFDLSRYIYWEYSVAVLLITEVLRALTKGIDAKIIRFVVVDNPKWLSLIVASVLAFLDWIIISNGNTFHLWQFVISFGVAVLGYDYALKLIKDQFKKAPDVVTTITETTEVKVEKKEPNSAMGFTEGADVK
jgi:hypothetical protein